MFSKNYKPLSYLTTHISIFTYPNIYLSQWLSQKCVVSNRLRQDLDFPRPNWCKSRFCTTFIAFTNLSKFASRWHHLDPLSFHKMTAILRQAKTDIKLKNKAKRHQFWQNIHLSWQMSQNCNIAKLFFFSCRIDQIIANRFPMQKSFSNHSHQ